METQASGLWKALNPSQTPAPHPSRTRPFLPVSYENGSGECNQKPGFVDADSLRPPVRFHLIPREGRVAATGLTGYSTRP